jgi:uncharacterized cofD-like protein
MLPQFLTKRRRWLTIGLGIKRWLVVLAVGAAVAGMGAIYGLIWARQVGLLPSTTLYRLITLQWLPPWVAMIVPLVLGALLMLLALVRLGRNLLEPFRDPEVAIADSLYEFQRRKRGPKIVAIGGGTGLSTLLRGLKHHTDNLTAIVTVADDGGSSGRLREELGILPPGDFRNNIAALARDEALMTQLLQYRFGSNQVLPAQSMLRGHAFGNLLLAALAGLTGSFEEGLLAAQRVLAIRGRVIPSTLIPVVLTAEIERDGRRHIVAGESAIPHAGGRIIRVWLEPEPTRAYPEAIRAILQADAVVIGPGSLYTSILPNLLVADLAGALASTRALRIYVGNVATQKGETDGFNLADHVHVLVAHAGEGWMDVVLGNELGPEVAAEHPRVQFVAPVAPPRPQLVVADLMDGERPWRHDSDKLAAAVMRVVHGE